MSISAANISGVELDKRTRPSIGIIPLGHRVRGAIYDFPAISTKPEGLNRLVAYSLQKLTQHLFPERAQPLSTDRLIVEGSSAGGNPMTRLLQYEQNDPDELHYFDATYLPPDLIIRWIGIHLARDRKALSTLNSPEEKIEYMKTKGGAFRNFYIIGMPTEKNSKEITPHLPHKSDELAPYYRDQVTVVKHADVPRYFGPSILVDVTAKPNMKKFGIGHTSEGNGFPIGVLVGFVLGVTATLGGVALARRKRSTGPWDSAEKRFI
eukprot:TRINITY_DN11279_c0_g1_i1.p1 TRINITY_DN11279_c0_g1~~TRINITY_DN11279_c0_g1_i1.p1  ORF type:complete len:265 (-),score=26.59 TRINITY_DN11279_c0_g1_i1:286-1080(-)